MEGQKSQINLEQLKKEIPYQWRVQSCSRFKPEATCVAYIDARDAMNLLDECVGAENWQDDYKVINNQMFAGVGIYLNEQWIWKWDTGTESETEKEKGVVSDSFKRACVKWGIGRFLYNLGIQRVPTNAKKSDTERFPYCIDERGMRIWDLTTYINNKLGNSNTTTTIDYNEEDTATDRIVAHKANLKKLNSETELRDYLKKHASEQNILLPLLTERKKEILANQ